MNKPAQYFAACTPNSHPHPDGRVEHGYSITILDQDMQLVTSVNLPGWETFRPEEVDQQLAITGFTVSDSTNPWAPAGPRYMATVHATGEQPS